MSRSRRRPECLLMIVSKPERTERALGGQLTADSERGMGLAADERAEDRAGAAVHFAASA